jgi:hypothetical protein
MSHPRTYNPYPFDLISPLLKSPDMFLWVPDGSTNDLLQYFLKGHLSPVAIREQNYAMFTQWLDEHHRQFLEQFQDECRSPFALRKHPDRSVSEWLTTTRYTDDLHKTFGSHLQALVPPIPGWSMPPVPPDRQELPLILLDTDGCVQPNDKYKKPDHKQFVINRFNQWAWNRTAEVRWMTYLDHRRVTEFAASVGLDTFEHGRDMYVATGNKGQQMLRWIERNPERQIVWIDIRIHMYLSVCGKTTPLFDRMVPRPNLLLVQPNETVGLTAKDLHTIDTFLAGGMKAEEVLAQNTRVVPPEKRYG